MPLFRKTPTALVPLVVLLCGGMVLAPERGAASGPGQMARPVLALACPAPADETLCRVLLQALAEAAPGRVPRPVAEPAPGRPGDLAVWLRLDERGPHHLVARLEWRGAGEGTVQSGPPLRLDVQDAELSAAMYPRFMADLVRVSDLPL